MKNRLWLWLSLVLAVVGCSVTPSNEFDLQVIDTSPTGQASYSNQWIANTSGKVFSGSPNLWGGGPFAIDLAFDSEGNLHNQFSWDSSWFSLHRIIMFYSGTQAIVAFYKSATSSSKLYDELYSLEIRGDKLYRTDNIIDSVARGFTTMSAWDGASYSTSHLVEIATLNTTGIPALPTLVVPPAGS